MRRTASQKEKIKMTYEDLHQTGEVLKEAGHTILNEGEESEREIRRGIMLVARGHWLARGHKVTFAEYLSHWLHWGGQCHLPWTAKMSAVGLEMKKGHPVVGVCKLGLGETNWPKAA